MTQSKQETSDNAPPQQEREVLHAVLAALRGLRYGSVVLTVHDGHVVEIQKTERLRVNEMKTPR